MNTITCTSCGIEIEVDKALEGQIEARVLAAERHKHEEEMAKVRLEQESIIAKERTDADDRAKRQLNREKELLKQQSDADLDFAKKKLQLEVDAAQRQHASMQESELKRLRDDAENAKEQSDKLREELGQLMKTLREEKQARANAEIDAQKKMDAESDKIREEVQKTADEKQRLNLAAKEKTITDLQKALDDAQRKAAQGSQQLQGEIMELDLEKSLADAFREDLLTPVPKGVNGADIAHTVRSPRGTECGVMLWEIKRTKNWVEGWIPKLKEDVRSAKANIAIIVTEVMPKHLDQDMGFSDGVWICKPKLAIVIGSLLRKSLLDVGLQKALAENRGDKADALYSYVTSHEFILQVENMVEIYSDMAAQVTKERVVFEKQWALREKQAQKLLMGTANVVGSMQGYVGQASMPRIKGLELGDGEL